ncbi:MAG TPA: hypothetical protein VM452_20350 [Caulifigura sp.]|nr:hypothetical protein [Caulifigura sp.]
MYDRTSSLLQEITPSIDRLTSQLAWLHKQSLQTAQLFGDQIESRISSMASSFDRLAIHNQLTAILDQMHKQSKAVSRK